MTDERLKATVASTLGPLFSSRKANAPISSFDLLALVIASGSPSRPTLGGDRPVRFRLTDLSIFERILEALSESWEFGKLTVSREGTGMIITDVRLGSSCRTRDNPYTPHGRKRKRVIDEDADSAAENFQEEEERPDAMGTEGGPAPSTLDSLSKDMKEVYALLQTGTARGKLLAEQVRYSPMTEPMNVLISQICSFVPSTVASSPFVLTLLRMSARGHVELKPTT